MRAWACSHENSAGCTRSCERPIVLLCFPPVLLHASESSSPSLLLAAFVFLLAAVAGCLDLPALARVPPEDALRPRDCFIQRPGGL